MTSVAKNKRLVIKLTLFVLFMCGFCYALVPLYNVLCKATGLNGKLSNEAASKSDVIDQSRNITVQFLTTTNGVLPWQFKANQQQIRLHPGESKKVTFFAENDSGDAMVVQAIPSVTPGVAAKYLKKTQCFCFERQTLAAGKSMVMPVVFHVDPSLPKKYNTITLSYTLFDVTHVKQTRDQAQGRIA